MTLPAEVEELLAWDEQLGRRLSGLEYARQRVVVRDAQDERARLECLVVDEVARTGEYSIRVQGGSIRLRVYTPSGDGPHGVFFHIHGGGFTLGGIDDVYTVAKCAHICASTGCVVTTVDYRLAPEFPYPTAPEDCYAALLWVVANAVSLGIDESRIVVGGESAGGNLAAAIALMARDRAGPSFTLQLLEVPVTDMSTQSDRHHSLLEFSDGYGLDRAGIDGFVAAYLPDPTARLTAYASPLLAENLGGLAPAHIVTAELDPLRDSGEAYARRLQEAGVRTTVHRFLGHTHGSSILWRTWSPAAEWMNEIVAAICLAAGSPRRETNACVALDGGR